VTPADPHTGSPDQWTWDPDGTGERAFAERAAGELGSEADLFGDMTPPGSVRR
jgi:hypothetical protein